MKIDFLWIKDHSEESSQGENLLKKKRYIVRAKVNNTSTFFSEAALEEVYILLASSCTRGRLVDETSIYTTSYDGSHDDIHGFHTYSLTKLLHHVRRETA